jgi:putative transposase
MASCPRMPRLVMPKYPHHVVQRGVRSMDVFRHRDDRELYLDLMRTQAKRWGLRFLGWCLMRNQVHLITVPCREGALARGTGGGPSTGRQAHGRRAQDKRTGSACGRRTSGKV